jgi:hypothetical protein
MKSAKKAKKAAKNFDPDRFIGGASPATPAPRPKRKKAKRVEKRSKAKPPAVGFTRASFDLSDTLHERLKIAAVREKRPMRELVEEALASHLQKSGH